MDKIAIYGSRSQSDSLENLAPLFSFLEEKGFRVFVETKFSNYLENNGVDTHHAIPSDRLPQGVAMVMSLGGDGTFLRAARWIGDREIPILGVNTGHLGFLATCALGEAQEILEEVCRGNIQMQKRMLLEVSGDSLPQDSRLFALNEVSLMRHGSQMLNLNAKVNDKFLAEYRGDGLIVSTPTGSTAYSLSAGGPIIDPTLDCICLCPVAPHTLTLRPLVVGADTEIKLKPETRGENFILSIDEQSFLLPAKGEFTIRKAPFSTLVIRKKEEDFATILRQKLLWSARP